MERKGLSRCHFKKTYKYIYLDRAMCYDFLTDIDTICGISVETSLSISLRSQALI